MRRRALPAAAARRRRSAAARGRAAAEAPPAAVRALLPAAAARTAALRPRAGATGMIEARPARWVVDGGAVGLAGLAVLEVAAQRTAAQGAAARDRELLADRGARGRAGVALGHQLGPGLEDEGLDLGGGDADRLADLGLGEPAELEQHERGALVLGQAAEVGDELAQVAAQLDVVGQAVEGRLASSIGTRRARRAASIDRQRLRAIANSQGRTASGT